MSHNQQGVVVFAKNVKRVSAFYEATLSLVVEESEAAHHLLRGGGYEVVVHAIPPGVASQIQIARPPEPRTDQTFKPTFIVPDLGAVRTAADRTGGYLKPADGAWLFRGCIVLDGWDPEGNVVQFKQREA